MIFGLFSIGLGNWWSLGSSFFGTSSKASRTSHPNEIHHEPVVGEAETHNEFVVGEAESKSSMISYITNTTRHEPAVGDDESKLSKTSILNNSHHEPVVGEDETRRERFVGEPATDTLAGIHKMPTTDGNIETIVSPARQFTEGVVELCADLAKRANGTDEGVEPWRSAGGLLWKHSSCGFNAVKSLGNHLSRWYTARAIASAAGVTIQLGCRSPVTNYIQQRWEPSQTVLENRSSFSWKDACQLDKYALMFPHESGNGLDHMVGAIRSDLRTMTQTILSKTPGLAQDLDEAVIHLRTGDVVRISHPCYGLVPYHVYTNLIPRTTQTIGIITAPYRQRRQVKFRDAERNEAVTVAARDYIQSKFPHANVSIHNGDETTAVSYARIVAANWSFCGSSSFCLFPALATVGESYILQSPLYGGSPSWLDNVAASFENVHYVSDDIILSTEYHGWNTTEIVHALQRNTGNDYQVASHRGCQSRL